MPKYVSLFENHTEYEADENSLITPNVSFCIQEDEVHYKPFVEISQHESVNLGLPSGTLWGTMNVGANSPTEYGNYYMYGMGSKTYDSTDTPYSGTESPLDLSKDTANVVWGGNWHIPTKTQMQELINNTTYTYVNNYNGSDINGGLFTAQNGNSVFFPSSGYYNNGQLGSLNSAGMYRGSTRNGAYPYFMFLTNGYVGVLEGASASGGGIATGISVRPVIG